MTGLVLAAQEWRPHDGAWFPFFPLIVLAVVVLAFVLVVRRCGRWDGPNRHAGDAVLAERYARGEIDEAEYRERRSVLRKG